MTTLSTTEINAIAAEAAGVEPTRSANKERAIAKLTAAMGGIVGEGNAAKATAAVLACANAAAASDAIRSIRAEAQGAASPGLARLRANPKAEEVRQAVLADEKQIAAIPPRSNRAAALNLVEAAPKPEKPARAEKKAAKAAEPGKRAAILEAAKRGDLPAAPDFSAETHKRFRAKLAEIVAAAEAGDIAKLKAFTINPVSSSPKAMAKYRDLAVIALEARAAKAA